LEVDVVAIDIAWLITLLIFHVVLVDIVWLVTLTVFIDVVAANVTFEVILELSSKWFDDFVSKQVPSAVVSVEFCGDNLYYVGVVTDGCS
jgi:hypothetical protein